MEASSALYTWPTGMAGPLGVGFPEAVKMMALVSIVTKNYHLLRSVLEFMPNDRQAANL